MSSTKANALSAERLEAGARQQVRGFESRGVCLYAPDYSGAGDLWGLLKP